MGIFPNFRGEHKKSLSCHHRIIACDIREQLGSKKNTTPWLHPKKQQPTNHLWHKTPPHSKSIPRKWMAMMAMEFPQKGGFSPTFSTKCAKIVAKMGIESSPNFRRSENPPPKSIWVFPKIGVPQNGSFIMENPY